MKYLLGLALMFILVSNVGATPLTMEESSKAACRINVYKYFSKSIGTGTVIMDKGNDYYILTNGHVINGHTRITVQFTVDGYMSSEIPAEVTWEYYVEDTSLDAALLKISKKSLNGFVPNIIPLAPRNTLITSNMKIQGAGYPAGRWNQVWIARVLKLKKNIMSFTMPPEGGQSGSGVTSVINDKTYWIGMVTWRISGEKSFVGNQTPNFGAGLTINRLYDMIDRRAIPDKIETNYHISETDTDYKSEDPHSDCHRCKLGKEHHIDVNGTLHCPLCNKHNKSFDLHTQDELLTDQCFPLIPRLFGGPPWGPGIRIPGPDPRQPRPNPQPNPDNGGNGSGPDGIWPDNPNTPDPTPKDSQEIDNLNKKIKDLELKLGQINDNNIGLEGQVRLWKKQLEDLTYKKDQLQMNLDGAKDSYDQLGNQYKESLTTITALQGKTNHWLDNKVSPYGLTGNGVENTSVILGSLLLGSFVGPFLTRKLGVVGGRIAFWFVRRAAKKAGGVAKNKIEDFFGKKEEKVDNFALDVYNINRPPIVNEHTRQQWELAQHNGEKPEEWAVKGQLYKEAVSYLRQGRLAYRPGVPLLGQEQAADAIDNWVVNGYMAKLTSSEFNELQADEILRNATLGKLYQIAVTKLRNKEFGQVLNPKDIADAVDTWVNKELMRLMTVDKKEG